MVILHDLLDISQKKFIGKLFKWKKICYNRVVLKRKERVRKRRIW